MKKIILTLVLIGSTILLKAQKLQPLFADNISNKIAPGLVTNLKPSLQFFQPQLSIANTLKALSTKSLFNTNEGKDRMPVAKLDGNSKMPIVKLDGYDNMPVAYIDVTDPALKGVTPGDAAVKTPQ